MHSISNIHHITATTLFKICKHAWGTGTSIRLQDKSYREERITHNTIFFILNTNTYVTGLQREQLTSLTMIADIP